MHRIVLLALAVSALFGQETPLDRLKREAVRAKSVSGKDTTYEPALHVAAVHIALRDWAESRLPAWNAAVWSGCKP